MATEERDCAAEWEWRFTHDERLIQEWQAAIAEVRRFNAEEAEGGRACRGLVKGAKIGGQAEYARIFICRRRPAA